MKYPSVRPSVRPCLLPSLSEVPCRIESNEYKKKSFPSSDNPENIIFYILEVERWLPEIRKNAAIFGYGKCRLFIFCAVLLRRSEKTERNVAG